MVKHGRNQIAENGIAQSMGQSREAKVVGRFIRCFELLIQVQ